MRRTTGIMVLLAVAGGCSSFQAGPDLGDRSSYTARVASPPGPATTTWQENDRLKGYQYMGSAGPVQTASYRPTAVCAALPAASAPAPQPVDSGMLPPPAPLNGTNAPVAVAAAPSPTPPQHTEEAPVSEPAPAPSDIVAPPQPVIVPPPPAPLVKTDAAPAQDVNVMQARIDSLKTLTEPTVPVKTPVMLEAQPAGKTPPSVRLVNNKRITINYEIKDVGPSGVSGIELWYTQDGKVWKKKDVASHAKPPYIIEVADEGLYGFTLLARNGIGLAKEAPKAGDLPQIWVEVDMTKPVIELTGIHANCTSKSQNVVVRWKAGDKNMGPKPITISYAEKAEGPWKIIAAGLPNTGRYEYPLPPEAPSRFHVKVEAADLVGNVGAAQTPKAVLMDRAQPTVTILTVEGGK